MRSGGGSRANAAGEASGSGSGSGYGAESGGASASGSRGGLGNNDSNSNPNSSGRGPTVEEASASADVGITAASTASTAASSLTAATNAATSSNANAPANLRGAAAAASTTTSSLYEAMRAPASRAPDVLVIGQIPGDLTRKETLDPREDLWLTTFDGRYNSDLIPIIVGEYPSAKTFTVHKRILEKAEFFRKALSGPFRESEAQCIRLPEDDPAIFHHVVAYMYEGRYEPIKPIASELIPDTDKGKAREPADPLESDSDSADSMLSNSTARSRRRRERRRRREDRVYENLRQKHPGVHRPNCGCPQCMNVGGSLCWNCNFPRYPPAPAPAPGPPPHVLRAERERDRDRNRRRHARRMADLNAVGIHVANAMGVAGMGGLGAAGPAGMGGRAGSPPPPQAFPFLDPNGGRIKGEDMRTWLLTYELNLDVYICADKFLMDDFKRAVARASIDMLETAGSDAAHPRVLQLCRRLYDGLGSDSDPLLRMVFARVGFLQPAFARAAPEETNDFLLSNPDIVALILKETTTRREDDGMRTLPSMERHYLTPTGGSGSYLDGPYGPGARGAYHNMHVPPRPPRF